jgi:hypothetical protein
MKTRTVWTNVGMATLLVTGLGFISTSAQAAECSGHDILVADIVESFEIAEGHTYLLLKSHSIVANDDTSNADHLNAGTCFGTFEILPDGNFKGDGYCTRTDADGDTNNIRWWWTPGEARGGWEGVTYTGKYAGRVESGWWETVMENGAYSASRWGGDCN